MVWDVWNGMVLVQATTTRKKEMRKHNEWIIITMNQLLVRDF